MTGNVYSTYVLAIDKAWDKMDELEQDVFICQSNFRSGQEFTLKTRCEVSGNYLYMVEVPFRHRFRTKANAEREAGVFATKKGRPVYVKKKRKVIKGYDMILHYYLTYKECST